MFKEKLYEDALRFYLGQHVLDRLVRDGRKAMELGTQWRKMSVLWIDIRGFEYVHEEIDYQRLRLVIDKHRAKVVECIARHDGTVDGFVGDAVLAYWDPAPAVNHAVLALNCAADLLHFTAEFSQGARESRHPPVLSDIGVDTGFVGIGNVGTAQRAKFTLTGDTINLTSRLVYRCAQYGVNVLITDEAVKHAGEACPATRLVDTVKVKGREQMVDIFTLAKVRQI